MTLIAELPANAGPANVTTLALEFDNNTLLPALYGEQDATLTRLEKVFGVDTACRGSLLTISGADKASVEIAKNVMQNLYGMLKSGKQLTQGQVDAEIRIASQTHSKAASGAAPSRTEQMAFHGLGDVQIKTLKKTITPYSLVQRDYIKSLHESAMCFALGPAGTGKTYIAVAMAVNMFMNRQVERIILSRPAVEAGEKLGFLPGDLKEKIDPYLRPLYDALFDMMPAEKVERCIESGEIEVAPLAFMRGRTLSNAFVILDEAQNSTPTQMKMFLTRMGENSRMVITGDLSQCDLPRDVKSGLADAVRKVEGIEGIRITRFGDTDVVRHDLAAKIVKAYEAWDEKKRQAKNAGITTKDDD